MEFDREKRDALVRYLAEKTYPEAYNEYDKRCLRKISKSFVIKSGRVLYHIRESRKRNETKSRGEIIDDSQLVIVDHDEKKTVMRNLHAGLGGGHFGMNKTIEKVGERYWWPGFTNDVRDFVKKCSDCQFANASNRPATSTLHPISVNSEFGYRWCVDLIGPLNETQNENRYIAVATEYLTRFAVAMPIRNKDATTVGKFVFEHIICLFGVPKILQHDQGREFCNNFSEFMCEKLQITKGISTAYHPQTNGLTERFNQTLVSQLMKIQNDNNNNWDEHIQAILFAYRVSVQESTRKTPFEMLFGIRPRLPTDCEMPTRADADPANDFEEAVARRMLLVSNALTKTREEGLENLCKAQQKQKKQYDIKHQGTFYDVEDLVLKYDRRRETRQGDKLQPRYTGPFQIAECCGKGVYKLMDAKTGKKLSRSVNSRDLKRFNTETDSKLFPACQLEECATDRVCSDSDVVMMESKDPECHPVEFMFESVSSKWMKHTCKQLNLKCHGLRRRIKGKLKNSTDAPPSTQQEIVADGNCLFRALSHSITNSEDSYKEIRALICDQIQKKPLRFLGSQAAESYLHSTKMREDKTWGTDREISAASDLLNTVIWCYGPLGRAHAWTSFIPEKNAGDTSEAIFLVNMNNHFEPLYRW